MPVRPRARRRTPAPLTGPLEQLGERLRSARTDAGLSQAQVGAPHFTRAYVSALELGKIRPSMKSLEFLAAKLGKPTAYFLADQEEERRRQERSLDIQAAAALLTRATAPEALGRVEQLLPQATTSAEICRLRLMAAKAHNFLAHGPEALRELEVADRLALQLDDPGLRRAIRHQTAIALRTVGDLSRARDLLTELFAEVDNAGHGDWLIRMKLLKDLGAVTWDLGEYERASAYYEAALGSAKEIGDVAGLVGIYNGLAYSRRALGDMEGATSYLQRALGATQISNDLAAAAIIHNALAIVAGERGHMEAAHRHVDRAIELARTTGPESYVAHYLNTKAECALKGGQNAEAGRIATEALQLAERTGNVRAGAAARVVLGRLAAQAGGTSEAIRRLEEAAAIYRGQGAKQELGEVLMLLSGIARERGDTDSAQRYAERAYQATKTASGLMGGNR